MLYGFNRTTFWKWANYGDSRKIRNWRGDGCIKRQSTKDFEGSENTLYDTVTMDKCTSFQIGWRILSTP